MIKMPFSSFGFMFDKMRPLERKAVQCKIQLGLSYVPCAFAESLLSEIADAQAAGPEV